VASAIGLVLSLLLGLITQPATRPSAKTVENQGVEFPPYDVLVWYHYNKRAQAQLATDLLARAPDSVETLQLLVRAGRIEDALAVLRRIVDKHPDRMADAFEVVAYDGGGFRDGEARGHTEALQGIIRAAKLRLSGLPRETAASAALQILNSDTDVAKADGGYASALRSFVQEYSGTEAALLAEVQVIDRHGDQARKIEALEKFAREHDGTVAGAKALYTLGQRLPSPPGQAESDRMDRFIRVVGIVGELTSGKYPRCEWVERAPSLVNFYIPANATLATATIDQILDVYTQFAKTNFALEGQDPANNGIGYVVTTRMADLFRLKAGRDDLAAMDRLFEELEDAADSAAVRYLQALYYMKNMRHRPDGAQWFPKARDRLASLYPEGAGLYHRKALATLASLYFYQGDYSNARDRYAEYVRLYPRTAWTWVAALRVGQCAEQMRDWTGAAAAYRTALTTYGDVPPARALGHAYTARAWEALGRFEDARKELERALAAWNTDYGVVYSIQGLQRRELCEFITACAVRDPWEVAKASIPGRIEELKRSATLGEGALLERGRWLLTQNRRREAWVVLDGLVAKHPRSVAVPEARYLAHRARVEDALELASAATESDEAAALKQLDLVAGDVYDFGVCAAKIAKAAILWRRGRAPEAEVLMEEALAELYTHQSPFRSRQPPAGVASDVAEIRTLLFRPTGDGVFDGQGSWQQRWPSGPPRFMIVNPDVSVTTADGDVMRLDAPQAFSVGGSVLFMDAEQIALLTRTIDKIGGTARIQADSIMAVPQPAGASCRLLELWTKFFPAMPGHWGGWLFYTFPILYQIEFLDDARTKALVPFRVGYQGATVVLQKTGGTWRASKMTSTWIE
jgi:tetratricopeptide (TPR) repeat protein